MKINNCGKFYEYSIYGRQVKNFKILYTDSGRNTNCPIFLRGGEGLSRYSPQYCPILYKFSPEVVFKQRKLTFE